MERKENCSSENALYYARILFVWFCLLGQVGHVVAKRLKVEVETPGGVSVYTIVEILK